MTHSQRLGERRIAQTSEAAAIAVGQDAQFERKIAAIILALLDTPGATPDEVARATKLSKFYVRPRLSELHDMGVIQRSGISANESTRSAYALRVVPEYEEVFLDCADTDDDAVQIAIAIWREAKAASGTGRD
jgi:DNA-binding MarR family transcriptional regulator